MRDFRENSMPRTTVLSPVSAAAALAAGLLLVAALCCVPAPARAADAPAKKGSDTTVNIKALPPSITVDAGTTADSDEEDKATDDKSTRRGRAHIRIDSDDENFDVFTGPIQKNPWIIGLIFLVVGSIFLTPVVLLIGIIWYNLRKTKLQNEAMLKLAETGVVPPVQAADALASSTPLASAAPQLYQQAVAIRKRVAWSDLRKGIMLTTIGGAFLLWELTSGSGGGGLLLGLILLFVGIGYTALWWLEKRQLAPAAPSRPGNGGVAGSSGG
jgi:hypothetical protein